MKVCVITNLYTPHIRGGAELIAKTMAEGFVAVGDSVVVISTKPTAGLSVEQNSGRCRIYRFRPLNIFYYLNDYNHSAPIRLLWHFFDMFNWHSAKVVAGILKNEKPDLVVTHNLKGIGLLIPRIIARLKLKHIHVLHDVQLVVPSGLILKNHEKDFIVSGWPTKIYAGICRRLFSKVGCVVSPSKWLLDFYVRNGFFKNAQQQVVRNPVESCSAKPKQEKTGNFLFVGQMEKHKGVKWLVDIWGRRQIDGNLLLVGDGSLRNGYESVPPRWRDPAIIAHSKQNCGTNIKFLGKKTGAELEKIYRAADFLIVPSLCYENSPMVIQLAFQNGVPVIVADIGGAAELVENKKTGFVFESGNEQSLLTALKIGCGLSAEDYNSMSKRCLKKSQNWSVEKYIEQIINLLSSIPFCIHSVLMKRF